MQRQINLTVKVMERLYYEKISEVKNLIRTNLKLRIKRQKNNKAGGNITFFNNNLKLVHSLIQNPVLRKFKINLH